MRLGLLTRVTTLCFAMVALLAFVCFSLYFGSTEVEALPPRHGIGNPPQVPLISANIYIRALDKNWRIVRERDLTNRRRLAAPPAPMERDRNKGRALAG